MWNKAQFSQSPSWVSVISVRKIRVNITGNRCVELMSNMFEHECNWRKMLSAEALKTYILSLSHTPFALLLSSHYLPLHHSPIDWSAQTCRHCKQRAFGQDTNPVNIKRQALCQPARFYIICRFFIHRKIAIVYSDY